MEVINSGSLVLDYFLYLSCARFVHNQKQSFFYSDLTAVLQPVKGKRRCDMISFCPAETCQRFNPHCEQVAIETKQWLSDTRRPVIEEFRSQIVAQTKCPVSAKKDCTRYESLDIGFKL